MSRIEASADEERLDLRAQQIWELEAERLHCSALMVDGTTYRRRWDRCGSKTSGTETPTPIGDRTVLDEFRLEVERNWSASGLFPAEGVPVADDVQIVVAIECLRRRYRNVDGVDQLYQRKWIEINLTATIPHIGKVVVGDSTSDPQSVLEIIKACGDELRGHQLLLTTVAPRPVPQGTATLVLAPTSAGILLHELIGHGAEEKWFGLAPGCRIGPRHLNVLATPPTGQRFDDEGIMTASRVLVEDGRLAEPLADRMTCSKGERPAGLAQAGAHYGPPRVRCTHIRVEGGEHDSGDLVADTGEGLYLPEIAQATVHDGVVVFRVVLARWIQGGLLGPPAEPFVVVMSLVSLAGQLAAVAGPPRSGRASRCSKRGDALPSTLVAPTLRIRNARVLPVRIPS